MMKRIICVCLSVILVCSLLTGCAGFGGALDAEEQQAYKTIQNSEPLSISEVTGRRLLASKNEERESEIYKYISDRIVVDNNLLIDVSTTDEKNINTLLANINTQLEGKNATNGTNPLIDEFANYLLMEFARTPYEWVQSNKEILGFDPSARLYFVDVTYTTTKDLKKIVDNSKIPLGHPDEAVLRNKRYKDYITMLQYKFDNKIDKYKESEEKFIERWGSIEDIFDEQQGVSLYERTQREMADHKGIGKLSYNGLQSIGMKLFDKGAKLTVRYVLKYQLNLGEETDMMVESLYVKDYSVNGYEDFLSQYSYDDIASFEVLKPFIDELIWSYHKCVEESNFEGLYSLYEDFSNIDKYYEEIRDYTYNSIGAYTYEVLNRSGHTIAVKVNRINQIRARGANMSLPTYEEELLIFLELSPNDKILIKNIYLLNRNMIGEPLSVIKNVSGISEQIQYSTIAFSESNRHAVIEALKKFSKCVTNGDYSSKEFLEAVDLGVSQTVLNKMSTAINSIVPIRKLTYIISWDITTNVYCSVTIREVFECDNGNFDTEAVVDLGYREGTWKVVNYTRTVNIKTAKNELKDEGSGIHWLDERTAAGSTTHVIPTDKPVVEDTKGVDPVITTPEKQEEKGVENNNNNDDEPSENGEDNPVETPIEIPVENPNITPVDGGQGNSGDFD